MRPRLGASLPDVALIAGLLLVVARRSTERDPP